MKTNYIEVLKQRRSRYVLKKESPLTINEINGLVKDVVLHTPTAFNSQTARVVLLFGKEHDALWDITTEELRKLVNDETAFASTLNKMKMFKEAFGTALFFEDQDIVKDLQVKYPLYKDKFTEWSIQATAMVQLGIWNAFAENGLGASLQHYNPIIDEQVMKRYDIPSNWKLTAQMPFGVANVPDSEKQFSDINDRVKVLGN